MRKLLIGSAVFLGVTAAASAADWRPAPPVAPVFTWTGLYLGVNAGGIWGDGSFADNCTTFDPLPFAFECHRRLSPGSREESSWLAGAQIGYNYQIRNWVFGVEVDAQATDLTRTANVFQPTAFAAFDVAGAFPYSLTYRASSEIDAFGTVRGRLGIAFDRLLVYGTGGAIFANVTTSHFLDRAFPAGRFPGAPANATNFTSIASHDSIVPGWIVGGGIEYAFWNNWSVKVEGMYYELQETHAGSREFFGFNFNTPLGTHRSGTDVDHNGFLVRGGINWRFSSM